MLPKKVTDVEKTSAPIFLHNAYVYSQCSG